MTVQIHHGDILYAENKDSLKTYENSYIVVVDGMVEGIYEEIPQQYKDVQVTEHGRGVIIPAFSDLHVHASQYTERGLGMDCLLYNWLNDYTFPQEAKLPSAPGRTWYEADIDYTYGKRNLKRILYSNDGLVFVSEDHYQTFYEITK